MSRLFHSKKGMSPLIAAVLLIAFTVAVAAILTTWASKYTKGQTKSVDDQTEKRVQCTWGELKLICSIFDIDSSDPPEMKIQVSNIGTFPLWDVRATLKNKDGDIKICNIDFDKSTLMDFSKISDNEGIPFCSPKTFNSTECMGIKETDIRTLYVDLVSCELGDNEKFKAFFSGNSVAEQLQQVASITILTMCPNVRATTQQCSSTCIVDHASKCPDE